MNCPNEFKNKITLPIFQLFAMALWILFFLLMVNVLIIKPFLQFNSIQGLYHLVCLGTFSIFFLYIIKKIGISPYTSLKNWWKNKKTHFKIALKYFLIYAGALILICGALIIVNVIFQKFADNIFMEKSSDFLRANKALKSQLETIFLLLSSCVFAPIVEEVFFRRFLFVGLRKKINFVPALLLSSFVFGIMHTNILMATIISLYLGYVYEKEKSLPANIMLHSMLNMTTFILFLLSSKVL